MLLQRVNHRTLVNLVGFCAEEGQRILVFEYLPNGTLHQRLHSNEPADKDTYVKLSWETRMRIVHQVACALDYLHHGTSPPLVHRDIKSANILLTANDSAKLADFGLAKSAQPDATSFQSMNTDIKGSHGYLDPSYVRSSLYSPKCDVYSYGVVVLEIVTGRPAMKDWGLLSEWAAEYLNDPLRVHEMVDERLSGDFSTTDLRILVDLVKLCLQDDPQARPTMQQVLSFLSDSQLSGCASTALGPVPDGLCMEPSPSSEQSSIPKGSSSSSSAAFSGSSY